MRVRVEVVGVGVRVGKFVLRAEPREETLVSVLCIKTQTMLETNLK